MAVAQAAGRQIEDFIARWAASEGAERANFQPFALDISRRGNASLVAIDGVMAHAAVQKSRRGGSGDGETSVVVRDQPPLPQRQQTRRRVC